MKLAVLSEGIGTIENPDWGTLEITHITHDSRKAQMGSLFVAIEGTTIDGHRYIGSAVQQGAVAILTDRPEKVRCALPIVFVEEPRKAMARMARRLYGNPDEQIRIVGITGTNGKTTGTFMVSQILEPLGKTGRIGTLTYFNGAQEETATHTTPESNEIYRILAEMSANGCAFAAMEISSHGLVMDRILGLEIRYALFTNLSRDHIDFHGDMDAYFQAKQKIFEHLVPGGIAVINWDDEMGRAMKLRDDITLVRYGSCPEADLRFEIDSLEGSGTTFTLHHEGARKQFWIPLMGRHNVYNFTAAAAVGLGEGLSLDDLALRARSLRGVPGRTEVIDLGQDFNVIVDFAHTPDALSNVLSACKAVTRGRLITVFGAGGNRDHSKRPEMGTVVDKHADIVFLTSDNPRNEYPEVIMDMVQAGMSRAPGGGDFFRDWDRRRAIEAALEMALPGDLVLIAGRGHERYQEIDGQRHPFDDRVVATHCIQARLERLSNV